MSKNLLIAAAAGLTLLAALLRFAGDTTPLIVAAPVALAFGWNIFFALEAWADKKRADIGDLIVTPLRDAVSRLTDSKDDFDHTLETMTGAPMMSRLNQLNAEIFQQFVTLVNVCRRIENHERPEFGSSWLASAAAAQNKVSSGFEMLLETGGGPRFNESAALVQSGLDGLHTDMERKIRELHKKAG